MGDYNMQFFLMYTDILRTEWGFSGIHMTRWNIAIYANFCCYSDSKLNSKLNLLAPTVPSQLLIKNLLIKLQEAIIHVEKYLELLSIS